MAHRPSLSLSVCEGGAVVKTCIVSSRVRRQKGIGPLFLLAGTNLMCPQNQMVELVSNGLYGKSGSIAADWPMCQVCKPGVGVGGKAGQGSRPSREIQSPIGWS